MLGKHPLLVALGTLVVIGLAGCNNGDDKAKVISLTKTGTAAKGEQPTAQTPLRFAVGAMITPKEAFGYYRQLLDYLGEKLGRPIAYVDKENYAEINKLLKEGTIDIAFVCSQPYVEGHDVFGLELLVAPQAYGQTVYYSYIIVARESPIMRFSELRGKRFAFTDPLSNSGKLVPTYMLAKMETDPDRFFREYVYTYGHDKSIKAVAQGIVDGAAVDSLIWEYARQMHPEFTGKTKIIEKSAPYGIPPVVVRSGLDPALKARIEKIFLAMHTDPRGKEILDRMKIDKFVVVADSSYDSIRAMRSWVRNNAKPAR